MIYEPFTSQFVNGAARSGSHTGWRKLYCVRTTHTARPEKLWHLCPSIRVRAQKQRISDFYFIFFVFRWFAVAVARTSNKYKMVAARASTTHTHGHRCNARASAFVGFAILHRLKPHSHELNGLYNSVWVVRGDTNNTMDIFWETFYIYMLLLSDAGRALCQFILNWVRIWPSVVWHTDTHARSLADSKSISFEYSEPHSALCTSARFLHWFPIASLKAARPAHKNHTPNSLNESILCGALKDWAFRDLVGGQFTQKMHRCNRSHNLFQLGFHRICRIYRSIFRKHCLYVCVGLCGCVDVWPTFLWMRSTIRRYCSKSFVYSVAPSSTFTHINQFRPRAGCRMECTYRLVQQSRENTIQYPQNHLYARFARVFLTIFAQQHTTTAKWLRLFCKRSSSNQSRDQGMDGNSQQKLHHTTLTVYLWAIGVFDVPVV